MSPNVNTTTNGTQHELNCINPTAEKIGITFAYCLIFVVSLAGNIFIGIIVYKTKTMRKPINFLIVNMAMSDLLFPIFIIPENLTDLYFDSWLISGPLGQALCKLSTFLPNVSFTVSVQSLVLIAVDRFGAVVFPTRSPLISSKLCPVFILATWIVAMATWSPFLLATKLMEYPPRMACEIASWKEVFGDYQSVKKFLLTILVVFYCIPSISIAILYIIIYSQVKTRMVPGEQISANARQQRVKRERNVLKMAFAIVLGFAVCWLPYGIGWILVHFSSNIWSCFFENFWRVALFLSYANCAINPCICLFFSSNYRQNFRNLFRCF